MKLRPRWRFMVRYVAILASASLIWEFAHMPFYELWQTGTAGEIAYAALHCSAGDVIIGLSALLLAIFALGGSSWPCKHGGLVALATIALGLIYAIFSEWLNVEVRQTWAYSDVMPTLPPLDTGLTPILQWIVIPSLAFSWAQWRLEPQTPVADPDH